IFVIMPNHVHGIVVIDKSSNDDLQGLACQTPTITPSQSMPREFAKPIPKSLGTIVGAFKAAVTRNINLNREDRSPVWQRNYHEHIIRDHKGYELIHAYIEANPQRWTEDSLYSIK